MSPPPLFPPREKSEGGGGGTDFKRVIKDQEYIFKDGFVIFKTILRKCKFISKISKSPFLSSSFVTMDLETRKIAGGILKPYCLSIYDGVTTKTFYLTDFKDIRSMLEAGIRCLMKRKYDGFRVYLHNFSNFDSIFLINTLKRLTDGPLKPNRRNGKLINVSFKFGRYTLNFRDSYLILPSSLRKLAIAFKVDNKGYFPHTFLDDEKVGLDYKGKVPSIRHFFRINNYLSFGEWKEAIQTLNECRSYINSFKNKS
jgi:hypothetical protein